MKIGDKIEHKRRGGVARIVRITIDSTWDDFRKKVVTKTRYVAKYDNGQLLEFNGYDIGKTVFENKSGIQLSFLEEL